MVYAFDRELEREWFSVLEHHDFSNLHSSADEIDHNNAIDAVGYNNRMQQKRFALRIRDESEYRVDQLGRFKREFSIRYKGSTDEPVEWQKLFEMDLDILPDYFCYGWYIKQTKHITDYVILDIPTLQQLHKEGHLTRYEEKNKIPNTRGTRTVGVYLSLPELLRLPSAKNLIVYHSDNHPALRGITL